MDRWNSTVYAVTNWLIYFAAPVTYVGNVQAALFDHLHASAEVANVSLSRKVSSVRNASRRCS